MMSEGGAMRGLCVQAAAVQSMAEAEATVGRVAEAGMDTVLYHVPAGYDPQGFDALAALIEAGQAAGVVIYAWVCYGADPYFVRRWPTPEGDFTDFGSAEARAEMAAVVQDLASRYEIAGVALDYMRHRHLIDEGAQHYGEADVTDAVRQMRGACPGLPFVAFVKGYKHDWRRWAQQWPLWLANGLIDAALPMAYHPLDSDYDYHLAALEDQMASVGVSRTMLVPCLSVITDDSGAEALKALGTFEEELAFFADADFAEALVVFDQRATPEHLERIADVWGLPVVPEPDPEPEDVAGIAEQLGTAVATLTMGVAALLSDMATAGAQAAALQDKVSTLALRAATLRDGLTVIDEMAHELQDLDGAMEELGRRL